MSSTRRPITPPLWGEEIFIGQTRDRHGLLISAIVALVLYPFCINVFAEPFLQLDAYLAVFDGDSEESTVSPQLDFALYTLFNSDEVEFKKKCSGINGAFDISAALSPNVLLTNPAPDLGLIVLDGVPILAVSDLLHGALPVPKHGIFDTYYYEYALTLDLAKRTALYDSQDEPGEPGSVVTDESFSFEDFQVDVDGLVSGLVVHLGLYTKKSDGTFMYFAHLP